MRSKKFVCWVIFFAFIFVGLFFGNRVLAEEEKNIELSYKILESYSDDQTLTMIVKLRARNISPSPLYGVTALVNFTSNISINTDKVYLGDISVGETVVSPESFTISMSVGSLDQEPPQKEIVWRIEYINANDDTSTENIYLK